MVMPTVPFSPGRALAAVPVVLSSADRVALLSRIRAARTEQRDLLRARIVWSAAHGHPNAVIAATLGIHVDTVRKWRGRFGAHGLGGLGDLPRSGRPQVFTDVQAAEVKAMACALPAESDLPLSRWSSADLAAEEYTRGGTLAYFAAYDVHHARVMGRIAPKTGIVPFTELVEHVMTTEPYASAKRVFWIVDNGSSHAGQASIDRMKETRPSAELVHLPIHASWLNQVEIYFSILQRKAIKPGNFRDLDHLAERVLSFENRYNLTAAPFKWNYSRDDLNKLIRRIADHDTPQAA